MNGIRNFYFIIYLYCLININILAASVTAPEILNDDLYFNVSEHLGELCVRPCTDNESRICYFNWHLEHYHAMGPACKECRHDVLSDCYLHNCVTADGVERGIMSINRQIPGPLISVCKNDLIVVDTNNLMSGTATSIHWHGIHMRTTPYMDGVPFVTQCPIDFATTFRYAFRASEPGTQFYHAHAGHHKVNGIYGGLIIRETETSDNPLYNYDYDLDEHVIVASDWMHEDAEMFMPGLPSRPSGILPDSLLINGLGRYWPSNHTAKVPLEVFRVTPRRKYRFRYINAASHVCPLQLQIEQHRMEIIASDSFKTEPLVVDTLISTSGERYDFIVHANQLSGNYWIRLRAIGPCSNLDLDQFAILSYTNNNIKLSNVEIIRNLSNPPRYDHFFPTKVVLNHPNTTCNIPHSNEYCISDLYSINTFTEKNSLSLTTEEQDAFEREMEILYTQPDYTFYLSFDNYVISNDIIYQKNNYHHFMNIAGNTNLVGAINNISFTFPSFPLLTQPENIDEGIFCDEANIPESCQNNEQICFCLHRIKIDLNKTVELVIVDETEQIRNLNHPFHLHGYKLYVVGMGQHPLGIPMTTRLAKQMAVTRTLFNLPKPNGLPPLKDTISIPSRGFTIVRFRADNPGFWLMHCHFEWHMAVGMGLVVQVGEPHEMIKPPTNDFPKCGNYLPNIDPSLI